MLCNSSVAGSHTSLQQLALSSGGASALSPTQLHILPPLGLRSLHVPWVLSLCAVLPLFSQAGPDQGEPALAQDVQHGAGIPDSNSELLGGLITGLRVGAHTSLLSLLSSAGSV